MESEALKSQFPRIVSFLLEIFVEKLESTKEMKVRSFVLLSKFCHSPDSALLRSNGGAFCSVQAKRVSPIVNRIIFDIKFKAVVI